MRRGYITNIKNNIATVVFSDIGIQKEALICRNVTANVGDSCVCVFNDALDDCIIVGVL